MLRIFLFLPLFLFSTPICIFSPPPGWEFAQPKNMSPHIQAGFVGKGTSDFRPSINLALEEVDISLKDYLKAVKQIHLSQPNTTWRDLGKFKLAAGDGRLTEISSSSPLGDVKMLQAILIQDNKAYILTAAMDKKDFPALYQSILESFQSMALPPDLLTPLSKEEQRHKFDEFFSSLKSPPSEEESLDTWKNTQWSRLQKLVLEETPEMGGYWQFLVLKDGYTKIHNRK